MFLLQLISKGTSHMAHNNFTNRKGLIIALIALLLATLGAGTGMWIASTSSTESAVTQPETGTNENKDVTVLEESTESAVAQPETQPETQPQPSKDSDTTVNEADEIKVLFARGNFCNEKGIPDFSEFSKSLFPLDFTNTSSIAAPKDFSSGSKSSGRLTLINGCNPLDTKPEVTFIPVDVRSDQCDYTHPDGQKICRASHKYVSPMLHPRPMESIFNNNNNNLPTWLEGKEMWEIGTSMSIGTENGFFYVVPTSSGVWEMKVTYEGKSFTTLITIPVSDTSEQVSIRNPDGSLTPKNKTN
jgi:F0F1-type ATP synthase membrane subunit c/vacuolar-type H+-ATPase subunit K